jgi:di/tricarboxylate transporter
MKQIFNLLLNDPILSQGSYPELARFISHGIVREFDKGETIYQAGDAAEHLFIVIEGRVSLVFGKPGRRTVEVTGRFGDEAGTDIPHYLSDAVAAGKTRLLLIPKSYVESLISTRPGMKAELYHSLVKQTDGGAESGRIPVARQSRYREADIPRKFAGWTTIVAVFPLSVFLLQHLGAGVQVSLFTAVLIATVLMWIFRLVDDYIPALFAVLAAVSMGMAPARVVLSGFYSDGFFLAMSVFGLSTVVVTSGLSYRVLLHLLHRLPRSQFWMNIGILAIGFLLTPIIPSANGRASLIKPLLFDMISILGVKNRGRAATLLAISSFTGITMLSGIFLTSKSVNLVLHGMLPPQEQEQFHWLAWFIAASFSGLVMLALFLALVMYLFRNDEPLQMDRKMIRAQLRILGKVKVREWAAVAGTGLFMLGILSCSFHEIHPPWLALAILYGLLMFGYLDTNEFRGMTDWTFLIYLGSLVGIVATFNHLGLDAVIAGRLSVFGALMRQNIYLFIPVLALIIFFIRFFAPINAAIVMTAAVFMPVAVAGGINPWVIGFIILVLGEMWFFPYQCSYYLQFRPSGRDMKVYDINSFLRFNIIVNFIKVAAIIASIPFWKFLGLL